MKKIRVGIMFGGASAEHEVSLQSARSILNAINIDKYEPVLIGIDRSGQWFLNDASVPLLHSDDPGNISLNKTETSIALIPGNKAGSLISLSGDLPVSSIDVLFPILHGPCGEDGSVQGLAKLANLPCVGAGIPGSAIGMDKDISKRLLRLEGILVANSVTLRVYEAWEQTALQAAKEFGLPLFVKPTNLGSSVGITKVKSLPQMNSAISAAFQYDEKVIIERMIHGREIECAVLGNDEPRVSVPGEIITRDQFYSYDAKYLDENGAVLKIPAELTLEEQHNIQDTALKAFKTLECSGMARVDMFLTEDGRVYVNEINTIPGFTRISMYPKLWEASGLPYPDLIDTLIQLAVAKHDRQSRFKNTR